MDPRTGRTGLTRRTLILGAAAGLAAAGLESTAAVAAADYTKVPKLPGETSRLDTQYTPKGTAYESIDVTHGGDQIRLFVPHASAPSLSRMTGFLWYYHANGSTHTSLSTVFKYGAMGVVDNGGVCVCPNYGGSLWTNSTAIALQKSAVGYVRSLWRVSASFLRSNSGGGALMTYAYGTKLIPSLRGMYLLNSAYDMEDLYDRDPVRVPPVYGYDRDACIATNPARLPQSSWTGARIRAVMSATDPVLPPQTHGNALLTAAAPVAVEASARWHDGGHTIPSWVESDMLSTFQRWLTGG